MNRRQFLELLGLSTVAATAWFIGIAFAIYAFRHPEQTDTQRVLNFWEVIQFK